MGKDHTKTIHPTAGCAESTPEFNEASAWNNIEQINSTQMRA
jgi:hypothetical protein